MLIALAFAAATLGLPLALYALLTMGQRKTMREIRNGARDRGWRYSLRRWQGNPTAFRIEGQTGAGLNWVLTSGNSGEYNRGWAVVVAQRFPELAGEVDFALLPREPNDSALSASSLPILPQVGARIVAFSGTAASAIEFLKHAQELPTGWPAFDSMYKVSVSPSHTGRPIIAQQLAERIMRWPADTVAPHAVLAWRDPFGFHFHARLPSPPNWATVEYLLNITNEFTSKIPASTSSPTHHGIVDRMVARFVD